MDPNAVVSAAVAPVAERAGGSLSLGVYDLVGGGEAVYGGAGRTYDSASVVKVDILAALLLRAQDEGRGLTGQERAYAADMIERSDNDAATALWQVIGGPAGLDGANARLGLTETAGAAAWGLTQTTARDRLALLRAVFGADSALDARARGYVGALMGRTVLGQDWGVSAAGTGWALKNGWLPRSTTGLWVVNSIGRVTTADGHGWLVAVLSDGHTSLEAGVSAVEEAARAAVRAVGAGW
ncbi:serine hydrolase [Streptomyces sp. TLI_146]|uniref:serine hydrolase n=1 Tax=Streptomyces sp. TLI_146 TaxID=1938858 RepID=UPI00214C2592|nr:serine hydrolase [Streptomyces sp. TLI_146]